MNTKIKDIKTFISYAKEDHLDAMRLYDDLKKTVTPWLDQKELLPGQNWDFTIRDAIKNSDFFLALLSKNSISKRGYVQKELKIALEILDEFPQSDIFIIPIRLDDSNPIDLKLRALHWVDLYKSYREGLAQLIRALESKTLKILSEENNKLNELATTEHPLLKKLLIKIPGTHHHSILVGSLCEAASHNISINPLIAKVCGYYHDIGKLNNSYYFVENIVTEENPHNKLTPWESFSLFKSHVSDGVQISKDNSLGRIVENAIMQHHGTSLVHYFYRSAKNIANKDNKMTAFEKDFRFSGPKPQTKVSGLLMLADTVEAAVRALLYPTPDNITKRTQDVIKSIKSSGELDDCNLTTEDLSKIENSFISTLNKMNEHFVEFINGRSPINN